MENKAVYLVLTSSVNIIGELVDNYADRMVLKLPFMIVPGMTTPLVVMSDVPRDNDMYTFRTENIVISFIGSEKVETLYADLLIAYHAQKSGIVGGRIINPSHKTH